LIASAGSHEVFRRQLSDPVQGDMALALHYRSPCLLGVAIRGTQPALLDRGTRILRRASVW
jgi:hypothetical protein